MFVRFLKVLVFPLAFPYSLISVCLIPFSYIICGDGELPMDRLIENLEAFYKVN
tara:strand:+ start:467 stop:628 length:162 start_codon:yes stop_codon:yes gene_type:complete